MRTFELRVYTLRTKEALNLYAETVYPRHLDSFPQFGIEAHGFWIAKADVVPRLYALVSYAEDEDAWEVGRRYLQSAELAEDVRDFDVGNITFVESTFLIPSEASPLK